MEKRGASVTREILDRLKEMEEVIVSDTITSEINRRINDRSIFRKLSLDSEPVLSEDKSKAIYKIRDTHIPVWYLPSLGFVSQESMPETEKVEVPLFQIQAAADWLYKEVQNENDEAIESAIERIATNLIDCEEEGGWRTIIPGVTTAFDGAGILPPAPAQLYEMPVGDAVAGYFSKELLNRMLVGAQRNGKNINLLWMSPEDLADIREYTDTDVDPVTRREIFNAQGLGKIWSVKLEAKNSLGVRGKYNITSRESMYGALTTNEKGWFNSYFVEHPNILDENGNLMKAGETQFYAFTEDIKDQLKMIVSEPYAARWDANLMRRQRCGFFGWQRMGMALFGHTSIYMGIVDRSMEDMKLDENGYMRLKPRRQVVLPTIMKR